MRTTKRSPQKTQAKVGLNSITDMAFDEEHQQWSPHAPMVVAERPGLPAQANGRKAKPANKANNKFMFSEDKLRKIRPPAKGQTLYWDQDDGTRRVKDEGEPTRGLCVLVSPGGTKLYRSLSYRFKKPVWHSLGRVGELSLKDAREQTRKDRGDAASGIDPREVDRQREREAKRQETNTYEAVVDRFVKLYCEPRQRTAAGTARILRQDFKQWIKDGRAFASITGRDAMEILRGFEAQGHGRKAQLGQRWIRTLWRWARREGVITVNVMEEDLNPIQHTKKKRKPFAAAEVKAIWQAADKLDPLATGYIKLLLLLVPRKGALANLRLSHLDDIDNPTTWTTPFEFTKSRKTTTEEREYLTPLPPLAVRVLKTLLKQDRRKGDGDLVFPGAHKGRPLHPGGVLKAKLIEHGAPERFWFHGTRHAAADWLRKNALVHRDKDGNPVKGCSDFEIGLVLNHTSTGVTAKYGGGYPLELKRMLLNQWADHIESLVAPKGAALLR